MFKIILLASAIFACYQSAPINSLVKCSISDDACVKTLLGSIIEEANGFPEIGVPPIDPYVLKGAEVVVLGLFKGVVDGTANGLSTTCKVNSAHADLAIKRINVELNCDKFSVEGHYAFDKTPALSSLLGNIDIHGDGEGSITLEQAIIKLEFGFDVKKLDDGETHFQVLTDDTTYTYKLGKGYITANNVYIGSQEISGVAVKVANENFDVVAKVLGNTVIDRILEEFYIQVNKFFSKIPAKNLVTDDI